MDPILLSKSFAATAAPNPDTPGQFTALVSAFGNEDSQGDIVEAGAFTKTLTEWEDRGRPIPIVWSHQFQDPEAFLGVYTAAEETEAGLLLTGQLDLDHPRAARVHQLMRSGVIVEFSISGQVRDYELIEKDDDDDGGWWMPPMRIKEIDLWEAGPCFKGANPETELLSVKAVGLLRKEGRVLAQKHVDALKQAHAQIGEIIAAAETVQQTEQAESLPPQDAGKAAAPQHSTALTPSVRALLELSQ
jgi:HK97 family phage prohead protease